MPRRPQFLIIGAARSGTTALYQHLVTHPGLFLTTPKEPHYFALAGTRPAFTGPGDRQTISPREQVLVLPHTVDPDPHRSGEPRNRFLSQLVSNPHPPEEALSPLIPPRLRRRLRRAVVRRNIVPSSYREETRRELVTSFRTDVHLLEQLTGLDLHAWRDPARPRSSRT